MASGFLVSLCVQCLFVSLFVFTFELCHTKHVCSQQDLINNGLQSWTAITADFQQAHNIHEGVARPIGSLWIVVGSTRRRRGRRERMQKRGCQAGLPARLSKHPLKPALQSIFLSNARSITHKMNSSNKLVHDCCMLIFTETWMQP